MHPMKKKRLISLIAAGGLGAATLAVIAASAQASAPTHCDAASKHAGTACVFIDKQVPSGTADSVRVNGRCLTQSGGDGGKKYYYGQVSVRMDSTPTVETYTGYWCEGNTEDTYEVKTTWADKAGKDTNFRRLTLESK
jgi:hypothetical protein